MAKRSHRTMQQSDLKWCACKKCKKLFSLCQTCEKCPRDRLVHGVGDTFHNPMYLQRENTKCTLSTDCRCEDCEMCSCDACDGVFAKCKYCNKCSKAPVEPSSAASNVPNHIHEPDTVTYSCGLKSLAVALAALTLLKENFTVYNMKLETHYLFDYQSSGESFFFVTLHKDITLDQVRTLFLNRGTKQMDKVAKKIH